MHAAGAAHGVILGISPKCWRRPSRPASRGITDPDAGKIILRSTRGRPATTPSRWCRSWAAQPALPAPATVNGLFGSFLDDDGMPAGLSAALAMPRWAARVPSWAGSRRGSTSTEDGSALPGPDAQQRLRAPIALPGTNWGQEVEAVRIDRLRSCVLRRAAAPTRRTGTARSRGLGDDVAPGVCSGTTAAHVFAGNVGGRVRRRNAGAGRPAVPAVDLARLERAVIPRGRRDIENLTQAANVNIPVLASAAATGWRRCRSVHCPGPELRAVHRAVV